LRPSGSSGPLLVTLENFYEYMNTKAAAWERQSYFKLRPLDQTLEIDLSPLYTRRLSDEDLTELKQIRLKLLKPTTDSSLDIKYAPGGLIDVELGVQTAVLNSGVEASGSTVELLHALKSESTASNEIVSTLESRYLFLRQVELAHRLVTQGSELLIHFDRPALNDTAQILGQQTEALWNQLFNTLSVNSDQLKELDPIYATT
ncbi:MAG: hypothetical protein HRT45_16010, partial [Bdellovibrionales bacterium]|nr:hypothetical protein [Bdellovibrionales bacterium]